jgi:hypothetical protein
MANSRHRFLKANVLSLAILVATPSIGITLGLWIILILVVCLSDGNHTLSEIHTQWGVLPGPPKWLDPVSDQRLIAAIGLGSQAIGLVGGALLGWLGLRYNHYLIVKKFRWHSQEEALRADKRQWL